MAAYSNPNAPVTRLDAVVIGAGVAGLYQLHKLRELGLNVRAYETGSGVGGTWYWNRYPGARFDSQAEIYQYWFSEDLYKAWKPTERFPAQPETESWLNWVADRLDLRKDIRFGARIDSAHYDDTTGRWSLVTQQGETIDTQYLVCCMGMLSAPLTNRFHGQSSFKGQIHHTALWPKEGVDLKGKRVAVVGVGATGIQVIQSIAPEVAELKVFVRTPQYMIPMRNPKYGEKEWADFAARFHELKARVRGTFAGFDYDFDAGPWADKTPAEREAVLQGLWEDGSLSMWLASFPEMFFDESVSFEVSEFVRRKMRERLGNDPALCELLIPTDYGFGTHRVPLESGYLEVYLRDNVEGVNCRATPIERIVPEGIQTSDGKVHEVDVIILAVGFDAGSGALTRMDIRGRGGRSLKQEWSKEIRTAMGMQIHGYPNLFSTASPLAPTAALCNMPTCLQAQVEWVTDCIAYARATGKKVVEPTREFEESWVRHHDEVANRTLLVKTDSWYMGSNVEGKPRRLLSYAGGVGNYHRQCDEQAAMGYPGFAMR
ncbi:MULTISPECIES: NAD(P)/FAD-dependent oxidoreductase [Methylibium]|uniref:flavin-containing monooxygenase n=1 Tax=Methylibium TaxID=316612 RepID=UPI0003F425BB|nr:MULTISPECIES: NAD(P)/FAD-dependent oxidoreductase [Methylibium]EWS54124.1 Phenylacetone monooxygenase [Methylibium sp. T29]EWS58467.1 Phenylacetone monooxygenase [Methylibium sp. T29-B]MBN9206942.1 NAD(P)/FAD-dependent oxidoreductase [Methylibium petroleiphilum]